MLNEQSKGALRETNTTSNCLLRLGFHSFIFLLHTYYLHFSKSSFSSAKNDLNKMFPSVLFRHKFVPHLFSSQSLCPISFSFSSWPKKNEYVVFHRDPLSCCIPCSNSTNSKRLLGKPLLSSGGVLKQKASKSMNTEFLHVERRTGITLRVNEAKPQRPWGNTHHLVSLVLLKAQTNQSQGNKPAVMSLIQQEFAPFMLQLFV